MGKRNNRPEFDEVLDGDEVDRVLHDMRTVGVRAAYEALLAVCRDPKAPAPAKATAGMGIARIAGLLERSKAAAEKQPHEMTLDEIVAERARLERRFADQIGAAPQDDGVFG